MWYRFAVSKPLYNPIVGGFYVDGDLIEYGKEFGITRWANLLNTDGRNINSEEKFLSFLNSRLYIDSEGNKIYRKFFKELKNSAGEFYVDGVKIEANAEMAPTKFSEILRRSKIFKSQDELDEFLSNPDRFEIINGRKIYKKDTSNEPTILKNPIGEFYVGDKKIQVDEPFNLSEWSEILGASKTSINSDDLLLKFLSNPKKFKIQDGKKFYIPRLRREYLINNNGEFYVGNLKIENKKPLLKSEWYTLLQVAYNKIQSQEDLDSFLSEEKRFKFEDGNKIYIPPRILSSRVILLKNPIQDGFLIDGFPIEGSAEYSLRKWNTILGTNSQINSQDTLNKYLQSNTKLNNSGDLVYTGYNSRFKKYINNYGEFYIGDLKIEKGKSFSENKWRSLLNTDRYNINGQEKLDLFLASANYEIDENGNRKYVPSHGSLREKYFKNNIKLSDEHSISVVAQTPIKIINSGKTSRILRLDFAFVKDNKIILAIEINGGQHYGFVKFGNTSYNDWQNGLARDVDKINYCHNNNIPLLIFNQLLPDKSFTTIINNLNKNPHAYDGYIPQSNLNNNVSDTSLEFIKRQVYSHIYPVINGVVHFNNDESKKKYIKNTLILISKLMGIYEGGIESTDFIETFNPYVDLTKNYNICVDIYNNLFPDFPLDQENNITYKNLSKRHDVKKPDVLPKENSIPLEE